MVVHTKGGGSLLLALRYASIAAMRSGDRGEHPSPDGLVGDLSEPTLPDRGAQPRPGSRGLGAAHPAGRLPAPADGPYKQHRAARSSTNPWAGGKASRLGGCSWRTEGLAVGGGAGAVALLGARAGDAEQVGDVGPRALLVTGVADGSGKAASGLSFEAGKEMQPGGGFPAQMRPRRVARLSMAASKTVSVSSPVIGGR